MADVMNGTFTADGESAVINWPGNHKAQFAAHGTWGGGTLSLMESPSGGEASGDFMLPASDAAYTADKGDIFTLPECKLKVVLSGATAPNLKWYILPVDPAG